MPRLYKLTYHKASKRWVKVIQGKKHYFSPKVKSKSDVGAYKKALEAYYNFIGKDPAKEPVKEPSKRGKSSYKYPAQSIAGAWERFVEAQYRRAKTGKVSLSRAMDLEWASKYFVFDFLSKNRAYEIDAIEKWINHKDTFKGFHKHLSKQPVHTANARWGAYRLFLRFLWEAQQIDELPRAYFNKDYSGFKVKQGKIETFSKEQVLALLAGVPDSPVWRSMRTYILLALNCSYTQMDLSNLVLEDLVEGGRLIRKRSKTGIQTNHLLWTKTLESLESTKSPIPLLNEEGQPLFFATQQGRPLRWVRVRNGKRCNEDSISKRFLNLRKRVFGEADPGLGFRALRRTSITLMGSLLADSVDRLSILQAQAGHKPTSVLEKHYWDFNITELDAALMLLGKHLGLD